MNNFASTVQLRKRKLHQDMPDKKHKKSQWLKILNQFKPQFNKSKNDISEKISAQVLLDCERSFCFGSSRGIFCDVHLKRKILYNVIISVLEQNSTFKYYQV